MQAPDSTAIKAGIDNQKETIQLLIYCKILNFCVILKENSTLMKKYLIIVLAAAAVCACCNTQESGIPTINTLDELDAFSEKVYSDSTLTDSAKDSIMAVCCEELYSKHLDDSTGLTLFRVLITNYWEPSVSLEKYEAASDLIKGNQSISTKMLAIGNMENVTPGKPYIDIEGPDALSGESLSISKILADGKPLIVDFWASWCPPCRREIKDKLVSLAAEGKVNIIGIAVWEESVENTRKAMEELSVSWPVIYSGGRENSPSVTYGVLGIPTLFLISPEGEILASGHSTEEFSDLL